MDTSRLRRFATEARHTLLTGINSRLVALGFNPSDGTAPEQPVRYEGGGAFRGETVTDEFYRQWYALKDAIARDTVAGVRERVAYTWFNRVVALQILVRNDLLSPVFDYATSTVRETRIMTDARQQRLPPMDVETRKRVDELLKDPAARDDLFRLLVVSLCHATPIVRCCFGQIDDYTELLLPNGILGSGGFVEMLNSEEYLSADDYRSPELIGWLYQFYISERKDEVYAQKGKFAAADIPAATQIFTPNWIVRYMVENTLGRIFLDNNPWEETAVAKKWSYLVPIDRTDTDAIYHYDALAAVRVADLACGSGHILNEFFDMLLDLYVCEGYDTRTAIESIFANNLTGIDIDTRAKQLAMFSLLLKACQRDRTFADAHCLPHVYDMPECNQSTWEDNRDLLADSLSVPGYTLTVDGELSEAFALLADAHCLGSIMRFTISSETKEYISRCIEAYDEQKPTASVDAFSPLIHAFTIILALTTTYAALVMNPPYMGATNMNATLSNYVKKEYPDGKADLFSTFMLVAIERLEAKGKYGMISMQSWMFLSSFGILRAKILNNYHIESLLHLGSHTFDELSGEVVQNVAFVIGKNEGRRGNYYRLVDGRDCGDKQRMFLAGEGYYPNISQGNFARIPGTPIGYWVSQTMIDTFSEGKLIKDFIYPRQGLITGDNTRFLRYWYEVDTKEINVDLRDIGDCLTCSSKWFPYNKGGGYRKWYGNRDYVVNWHNNGQEIKELVDERGKLRSRPQNTDHYFHELISYSDISSGNFAIRYYGEGFIFDSKGPSMFNDGLYVSNEYVLGAMNSNALNLYFILFCPTISFTQGTISQTPIIRSDEHYEAINALVKENIAISRADWDAHETSWDFQRNELVAHSSCGLIEEALKAYQRRWETAFYQLHANEEELNRRFIDIYGLGAELSPAVSMSDVTLLQQGEVTIAGDTLQWHDDIVIRQLISYAIGCMMGRYSVDRPGLVLANQGDDAQRYDELVPDSRFSVDSNGIIPLMPSTMEFADNATARMKAWLSVTFGADNLTTNLNYIELCLGRRLDDYLVNSFWTDHKRMYQNRPIYWLFASRHKAFQCLVYMHRMTPYTAETLRTRYLLPHIDWLVNRQREMEEHASQLSVRERKELDNIGKQLADCREYHDRLHSIADKHLAISLDDGVIQNYAKYGDVLAKLK